MSTNNTYNGWSNYETWNANLWLDNDWRMSEHVAMIAADLTGSYESVDKMAYILAERINDMFAEMMPDVEPGFFSDMMSTSLREVNFNEIARHYIEAELHQQELEREQA